MVWLLLMSLGMFSDPIIVSSANAVAGQDRSTQLSYDAVEPKGRRKAPAVDHRSEDLILDSSKRSKLTANSRDIARNFSIAKWMVRRHLDYVATFEFHARADNDAVDEQIETLMLRWSRKFNCDRAARHPFWRIIRLVELLRTTEGDVGLLKLANGQLQIIEGDRIRNPGGATTYGDNQQWIHGVKTDPAGRALAYAIHSRKRGGYQFERSVPAGNMCLHGYFDRADQVRGISPIVSALNPLRDVYENFSYALAKAKVTQLFAMAFFRDADDDASGNVATSELTNDDGDEVTRYQVDFGGGPVKLELDPGDDVKFLESSQPSSQFQEFTQSVIAVALKALDIPYSFYDESHTNFFGSRAAWLHYDRSCRFKRADLIELLNQLTAWRIMLWVLDGDIQLPPGMTIADIDWEWVPTGLPWFDPAKEINGDLLAIRAGLDYPQRITKERGKGDWFDNVDQISQAIEYAREKGVPLAFDPLVQPIEVVPADGGKNGN